jgi:hypothetical protein
MPRGSARAPLLHFPDFRGWRALRAGHTSRHYRNGKFSIQTYADDGGAKPGLIPQFPEMLRFVSIASHSIPLAFNRAEGVAKRFSEGVSGARSAARKRMFQELSCAFLGFPHAYARSRKDHALQTSQNELAEPYKYSNTIHTSSTAV